MGCASKIVFSCLTFNNSLLDEVTSLFRKKIAGNTTVHAQMKAECIQTSYVVYKFNYIRYE